MLIIARYNEDISWVNTLDIPTILYNKGDNNINHIYNSNIIPLSNIGRESHTYLHYILNNYNGLPENIIFSQGNPFPHCHNFIELIKDYNSNKDLTYLSHWIVTEDLEGRPHAYGYGMVPMMEKLNIPLNVNNFIFPAGAQFIVNKKLILNKSLEWWVNAYSKHNENELSPWIYERLWPLIFNYNENK